VLGASGQGGAGGGERAIPKQRNEGGAVSKGKGDAHRLCKNQGSPATKSKQKSNGTSFEGGTGEDAEIPEETRRYRPCRVQTLEREKKVSAFLSAVGKGGWESCDEGGRETGLTKKRDFPRLEGSKAFELKKKGIMRKEKALASKYVDV